jgi:hypothetical protein
MLGVEAGVDGGDWDTEMLGVILLVGVIDGVLVGVGVTEGQAPN